MPKLKPFLPLPEKPVEKKIYSDLEMQRFDREVRPKFFNLKTYAKGDTANVFDTVAYLKSSGAMNPQGGVLPSAYEREMDRLDQWVRWSGRKQYGQKKRLQEYDGYPESKAEVAKKITINE